MSTAVRPLPQAVLTQISARCQQLSIQNRRAGSTTNGIVTESHKPKIQHVVRRNSANRDSHPVSGVTIQARLRSINLIANDDWLCRRRMKVQLLRHGCERSKGLANLINRGRSREFHANRSHMPIGDVNTIALGAYFDCCVINSAIVEPAEQFQSLSFNLLFFAADERDNIIRSIKRSYSGIACAR